MPRVQLLMIDEHALQMKEEGWWLVLGDSESDELLALKRLSFSGMAHAKLLFPDDRAGGRGRRLVLHLVSDSYLGLDQKFEIELGGKYTA